MSQNLAETLPETPLEPSPMPQETIPQSDTWIDSTRIESPSSEPPTSSEQEDNFPPGKRLRASLGVAQRKHLRDTLEQIGVPEDQFPDLLKDRIIAKSKNGPLGVITLRSLKGVEASRASRAINQFQENVGSLGEIAEKLSWLSAHKKLSRDQEVLLGMLDQKKHTSTGLAKLIALSGAEPAGVMQAYGEACIEMGRVQAAIEAHRHLPGLVKNLYKHALSESGVCQVCVGTGTVVPKLGAMKETRACPNCNGKGTLQPSKLKEFAMAKILEMTKQIEAPGSTKVAVSTQVGVKVDGKETSVFEKVMGATDEVLYRREKREEIVDAEVIHQPA